MPFEGIITLGAGHSLVQGYRPQLVTNEVFVKALSEKAKDLDTNSYGLFGGSINYNTYYPDASSKDFTPSDEDFIEPTYRMLSKCIVSKYYPTDFSEGDVLKESMHLLVGQTINCDHDTEVGNAVGSVKDTFWQEAYQDSSGRVVPAGINGLFKIDAKSNPRLSRGILMTPPSIHSNSVTVRFLWDKSHPELSDGEFYDKMGAYDAAGVLIRRVVTKILSYQETSLVSNGADPFAKQIRDGKIVNVDAAFSGYSFSSDPLVKHAYIFSDFKKVPLLAGGSNQDLGVLSGSLVLSGENELHYTNKQTNKNEKNMEELERFLATLFVTDGGLLVLGENQTITAELVVEKVKGLTSEVARLKLEVEEANKVSTELGELKLAVEADKNFTAFGKTQLASVRSETLENYRKLYTEEDPVIVNLINTGDDKSVMSLNKAYLASLEEKYPLSCKACGSKDVSRASSVNNSDGGESTQSNKEVPDTREAINSLKQRKN